ncbi:MAG TPA: ADOP family duplicated permease [Holophagaceae bacterium]|nr:ADOP family duplicated permease [Holophagaceae bacterium]
MQAFLADLAFAIRMMRKTPFLTLVAILSLALGLGANTTVYAWLRGAVLRPLSAVPSQERLVVVSTLAPDGKPLEVSHPDFRDLTDGVRSARLAASRTFPVGWQGEGPARRIWANAATGSYFQVAGIRPALGRLLQPADDQPGQPVVAVLGYGFWRRSLAGDPTIVGRSLRLDGADVTVVGIAQEGFLSAPEGGVAMDVFVPLSPWVRSQGRALLDRGTRNLKVLGRLAPGAGLAQVQAEASAVSTVLAERYPEDHRGLGFQVTPLSRAPWGSQGVLAPTLRILLAAVGLVLLLACANVASLLLTRTVGRQQEFAVRAALGAGRARLARQLMTEGLLLGLAGGGAGLLAALWARGLLQRMIPPTDKPVQLMAGGDGSVLAFTLLLSLGAGLLLGLLPLLASRLTPSPEGLKEGGSRATASPRARRWLSLLVALEMALATLLLAGAGLLIRSLEQATRVPLGFQPAHVLLAGIELNPGSYPRARKDGFAQAVLTRLRETPGIEQAAFGTYAPLGLDGGSWETLTFEGHVPARGEDLHIYGNAITPGYFSTLGIPLLEGRDFGPQDREHGEPVIILSEAAARRYFPGGALGKRVKQGEDWRTVIGVAADIKVHSLSGPPEPFAYYPLTQWYTTGLTLQVRTSGDPWSALGAVQNAVAEADPEMPLVALPMSEFLKASTFLLRMAASLLALLGAMALGLACLGIFGVMSFGVAQRTQELGVRMALGAAPAQVLRLVLTEGLMLAGAGALAGLLAMALIAPGLGPLLVRTDPRDPLILAGVPLLLLAVAAAACALPALRASRTDPAAALRSA